MPKGRPTPKPVRAPKAAPTKAPTRTTAPKPRPTASSKPFQARNTVLEKGIRTMNGKKK